MRPVAPIPVNPNSLGNVPLAVSIDQFDQRSAAIYEQGGDPDLHRRQTALGLDHRLVVPPETLRKAQSGLTDVSDRSIFWVAENVDEAPRFALLPSYRSMLFEFLSAAHNSQFSRQCLPEVSAPGRRNGLPPQTPQFLRAGRGAVNQIGGWS